MDPQGRAQHDDYIAQWQEWSWIYEGVITTLTDEVKATIAPWRETIVLDRIVLLFVLIQEYASMMNEALIIAYEELREENLKLSKFGNDVKKMTNHIRGSSRLIQACGEQVSRQTFIIIFKQLTAYRNPDFQWMFGAFYEQWRNRAGEGYELTLNQLLTKADSKYTHLVHRNQWKTVEDLQIITLMAEIKGLQATVAKFQRKPIDPKSRAPEATKKPAHPPPNPKLPDKIMHWKRTPPKPGDEKKSQKDKSGKMRWWCETCNLWNLTHMTEKHKAKNPLAFLPGASLCQVLGDF